MARKRRATASPRRSARAGDGHLRLLLHIRRARRHRAHSGTTQETWKFNVDAQCALNLTVSNAWPKVIAAVTKHEMPAGLSWAVKGLTVAVSTIFISGYAALGARHSRSRGA